ncbi:MAG: hypothetical protein EP343_23550 [Deltaproteobacteria bacterium]|nr:MAG: hypothetical protein EP343_23550 [Deltaproteobacteria bacterium]
MKARWVQCFGVLLLLVVWNPTGCYINLEAPSFVCSQDGDCPLPNLRCVGGVCVQCNSSVECKSKEICRQNLCQPCGDNCDWTLLVSSPGTGQQLKLHSAQFDANGMLYLTGQFQTGLTLENTYTSGSPTNNWFVTKIEPPSKIVWVRTLSYTGNMKASRVLAPSSTTLVWLAEIESNIASEERPSLRWKQQEWKLQNKRGIVALCLTQQGALQWHLVLDDERFVEPTLTATRDPQGNLYLAGSVQGRLQLQDQNLMESSSEPHLFVLLQRGANKPAPLKIEASNLQVFHIMTQKDVLQLTGHFQGDAKWGETTLSSNGKQLFVAEMTIDGTPKRAVQSQSGASVEWLATSSNNLDGLHLLVTWRPLPTQTLQVGKETLRPPEGYEAVQINHTLWVLVTLTNNLTVSKAQQLFLHRNRESLNLNDSLHWTLSPSGQVLIGVSGNADVTFNKKLVVQARPQNYTTVLWNVDNSFRQTNEWQNSKLAAITGLAWDASRNHVVLFGGLEAFISSGDITRTTQPDSRVPDASPTPRSFGFLWYDTPGGTP